MNYMDKLKPIVEELSFTRGYLKKIDKKSDTEKKSSLYYLLVVALKDLNPEILTLIIEALKKNNCLNESQDGATLMHMFILRICQPLPSNTSLEAWIKKVNACLLLFQRHEADFKAKNKHHQSPLEMIESFLNQTTMEKKFRSQLSTAQAVATFLRTHLSPSSTVSPSLHPTTTLPSSPVEDKTSAEQNGNNKRKPTEAQHTTLSETKRVSTKNEENHDREESKLTSQAGEEDDDDEMSSVPVMPLSKIFQRRIFRAKRQNTSTSLAVAPSTPPASPSSIPWDLFSSTKNFQELVHLLNTLCKSLVEDPESLRYYDFYNQIESYLIKYQSENFLYLQDNNLLMAFDSMLAHTYLKCAIHFNFIDEATDENYQKAHEMRNKMHYFCFKAWRLAENHPQIQESLIKLLIIAGGSDTDVTPNELNFIFSNLKKYIVQDKIKLFDQLPHAVKANFLIFLDNYLKYCTDPKARGDILFLVAHINIPAPNHVTTAPATPENTFSTGENKEVKAKSTPLNSYHRPSNNRGYYNFYKHNSSHAPSWRTGPKNP